MAICNGPGFLWVQRRGEVQRVGPIYVNDSNTAFAAAYTIGDVCTGIAQALRNAQVSQSVRVDNVAALNYIGSMIVGDTICRNVGPRPGSNSFARVSVNVVI